jgi:DNA-binding response OmpR family regulator
MRAKVLVVDDDVVFAELTARPRVLIVDDDVEFAELIEYNLSREGWECCKAHTGVHGLRMIRSDPPDLILLDIMLPDLDGLSVCEVLGLHPGTRDIPVFMVSALDESTVEIRMSKARFSRFFRKPVDLPALRQTVRAVADERMARIRCRLNLQGQRSESVSSSTTPPPPG